MSEEKRKDYDLQTTVFELIRNTSPISDMHVNENNYCGSYWSFKYQDIVIYKITMKTNEDLTRWVRDFKGDLSVGREKEHLYYVNIIKQFTNCNPKTIKFI